MKAVAKTLQGARRRKIGKGGEGEGKGSPRENPFGRGGNADFCRILFFHLSHEGVPSFLPVRQHNKIPADNLSVQKALCAEQSPTVHPTRCRLASRCARRRLLPCRAADRYARRVCLRVTAHASTVHSAVTACRAADRYARRVCLRVTAHASTVHSAVTACRATDRPS